MLFLQAATTINIIDGKSMGLILAILANVTVTFLFRLVLFPSTSCPCQMSPRQLALRCTSALAALAILFVRLVNLPTLILELPVLVVSHSEFGGLCFIFDFLLPVQLSCIASCTSRNPYGMQLSLNLACLSQ